MSSFLSSLYILEISPLSDVGLVKIYSLPLVDCVLCLTEASQFQDFHFYCLLHSVSVLLVLYLGSSPCVHVFNDTTHFLFSEGQYDWIYIEVFDPFGLEFCTRG